MASPLAELAECYYMETGGRGEKCQYWPLLNDFCVQVAKRNACLAVTLTSTCWTHQANCLSDMRQLPLINNGIKCQVHSTQSLVMTLWFWLIRLL